MFEHIAGPIYFRESMSMDSNVIYIDGDDRRVLVDTGTGMTPERLNEDLEKLGSSFDDITDIILTHSHIDHIGGVPAITARGNARIHLHREEAERINAGDMTLTLASTFGARLPPMRVHNALEEGDMIDVGGISLHVYHTPGHSIGSICLLEPDLGVIITGDTMFAGGSFGRVDFPTGNPRALVESLRRISELDFQVALPGHMNAITRDARISAMHSYKMAASMFTGPI